MINNWQETMSEAEMFSEYGPGDVESGCECDMCTTVRERNGMRQPGDGITMELEIEASELREQMQEQEQSLTEYIRQTLTR